MLHIVTDQKLAPIFCRWLSERISGDSHLDSHLNPAFTRTIAHVDREVYPDGTNQFQILVVAAFHHWSPSACEITVATNGDKRKKASHEFIWTCFSYVFDVCKKTALFATISQNNVKCLALAAAMGLTERGRIPDYFCPSDDALLYSITRDEWQRGRFAINPQVHINNTIVTGKTAKDALH